MMDEASKIVGLTPSVLWITLAGIIGIGIIVKLAFDLIIKWRELRTPKVMDEKTVQDKLKSDHERLSRLEDTTKRQDEELKLILRSQMAMIHHMIDGNGTNKLKEMQSDIEEFLITGKMKHNNSETA